MLTTVYDSKKITCRYNNHKLLFKHHKHSHDSTVMSKDIWDFSIKWSIVMQSSSYKH